MYKGLSQLSLLFCFKFLCFILKYVYVYVSLCMCEKGVCICKYKWQKCRNAGFPRAEVSSSHKTPNLGVGNHIQVLGMAAASTPNQ